MAKFKVGDRVRNVRDAGDPSIPLGGEFVVTGFEGYAGEGITFVDVDGDARYRDGRDFELVTDAPEQAQQPTPQPFNPAKLRKGDKVLVEMTMVSPEPDADGDVLVERRGGAILYVKAADIIGYAPGYTPQRDEPLKVGDRVTCAELFSGAAAIRYIAKDEACAEADTGGLYTVMLSDLERAQ